MLSVPLWSHTRSHDETRVREEHEAGLQVHVGQSVIGGDEKCVLSLEFIWHYYLSIQFPN
jgi:hypothetical protein